METQDLDKYLNPDNEDFVDNFNKLIEESYIRSKTHENSASKDSQSQNRSKTQIKKKAFNSNIFKDPPSWKPTKFYGEEFDKLKILKNKHCMDNWEIYRINLVERSYAKQQQGKDSFKLPNIYGKEFGDSDYNKSLSPQGVKLISRFINENKARELSSKRLEEAIYKYKHSKPEIDYNPWKITKQIGNYFSSPAADQVHSYKISPKVKFANPHPFKRTKIDGDYFNKIDLTCEFEKYAIKN